MAPTAPAWGERLNAFAGYHFPPTTFGAMLFYLPEFNVMARRAVRIKDRLWELWSPNSTVHAYYPGTRNDAILLGNGLPKEQRRSDGHLGRFDYTMVPQHYDCERPWLGFIRKWAKDSRPENALFFDVWVLSNTSARGVFRKSFLNVLESRVTLLLRTAEKYSRIRDSHLDLWDNRPQDLSVKTLIVLRSEMRLDDAVDTLAAVQRDVKELAAWNRMADSILKSQDSAVIEASIPPADDTFMGVWLNGCDEESGLWLLRNKVPCYIVREGDDDLDRERMRAISPYCVSMTALTQLKQLEDGIRNHERLLMSYGMTILSREEDIAIGKYSDLKPSSLASRLMASPEGQGFANDRYTDPRISAPAMESIYGDILVEVDGKIIPPPVIRTILGGSWTYWVEDSIDKDKPCMRKRSSNYAKSNGGHHYFDRANKRVLYFDEPLTIPRHYDADVSVFGWPVPQVPYIERSENGQHTIYFAKSSWCYEKELPNRVDVGRAFVVAPLATAPDSIVPEDMEDVVSLDDDNEEELRRKQDSADMVGIEPSLGAAPSIADERDGRASVNFSGRGSEGTNIDQREPFRPRESRSREPHRRDRRLNHRRAPTRQSSRHYSPSRQGSRYQPPPRYSYNERPPPYRRSRSRSPIRRLSPPRHGRRSRSPRRAPSVQGDPPVPLSAPLSRRLSPAPQNVPARQDSTPSANPSELSLLTRMGFPEDNDVATDSLMVVHRDPRVAPRVMEMFPIPSKAPVSILSNIGEGRQTRFLLLWNIPVIYCWDKILDWIFEVLRFSFGANLKRVHRTNEGGLQVFWLVFATEHQATTFRGVVADRWTNNGHHVKCDFVSPQEYGAVAGPGHQSDKWVKELGYVGSLQPAETFPDDRRDRLSHPSLAERLGVTLGPVVKPTKRGKRAGAGSRRNKQSTDGGAL